MSSITQKLALEAAAKLGKEAIEKALKESIEKTLKEAGKEASGKLVKESIEKLGKEGVEKALKEATDKALKEGGKEAAEKALKEGGEKALKETGLETGEKALKEGGKEAGEKALKEGGKEAGEKALKEGGKEAGEKTLKEAGGKIKNLGKGLLAVGAVVGAGIVAMDTYDKSKKEFDKRNEKTFKLIEISNDNNNNIKLVLENPENLKFYKEEQVEITNSDINFNGKYEITSSEKNNTVIMLKYQKKLDKNGKTGNIKLFADMKNDLSTVVNEDLKKLGDVTGVNKVIDTVTKMVYTAINYGVLFLTGYIIYLCLSFFMNSIYSFFITAIVLYFMHTYNIYLLI